MAEKSYGTEIFCIFLLILAAPAAAADYPMFHADSGRTGAALSAGPLTNTTLWVAETAEYADGSPAVHDGKVFVPTWPDMDSTNSGPMGLVCYNATTGRELWTNELGGPSVGSVSGVAVADGHVYLGGTDGKLYCIDEGTGSTLWSSDQIDTTGYFGLSSSPLVYEGKIYALSASDSVLHTFTPEGVGSWSFPTSGAVGYFTSPAAADGKVFVAGNESSIFCINASTHAEVWNATFPTAVKSTPVVGDGKVYVTTANSLYALNAASGAAAWNTGITGTASTPAVADGTVIVGSSNGLHAYNATDGTALWVYQSARIDGSPVIAGGVVYFGTNEKTGTVYAVNMTTGSKIWSYALPDPGDGTFAAFYASSPAVSDGVLYIGAENNRFYAFGAGKPAPTTIWDGSVSLSDTTFTFVPSNNASASYEINRTTDLGALDTAATEVGFTFNASDAWYASYGSFLLEDIEGIANEDWTKSNAKSWSIFVNGSPAPSGLGANDLKDGDELTFYYCPTNSTTYAPLIDEAAYVVAIDINVSSGPTVIWDGSVALSDTTFTFVPSNNASASYEINRTTDLGALDTAATEGGLTFNASDAWYASYGSFLLEDIEGIANEDWTKLNAKSWSIFVNGSPAPSGLGANDLEDGDELTFYYCPTNSTTYAPIIDEATYVLIIDINASSGPTVIWKGSVALSDTTFTFVPSNNASASHEINRTTDLGALDTAAKAGRFTFNASDADYTSYGSFYLEDINSIANEDWTQPNAKSWSIFVNGVATPAGLGGNDLVDGDRLTFYYCPFNSTTYAPLIDEAAYVVDINVTVTEATVGTPPLTNGTRGGYIITEVEASADRSGWYSIVVGGTNSGGDAIAGIGTVMLDAGETVRIPVIVSVPARTGTGTYTLYAGIYSLDNYPAGLISHSGGSECTIA
ncbi:outer membrane protein assembly factor BamB family protein [Methanofollis ethanolicus]|uniref:outer membrane protein assembly factor BamB family protein n=1 Tax=Methanofollis ethanolicus TaxID=488124 RepID=UPI000835DC77|nr:PQQ-binding-like beta-propeller repeat protein [Methanofollis ethanolicus]